MSPPNVPFECFRVLGGRHAPLATPRRAMLVHHHVDRETMQPGAERTVAAKQPQLAPQTHEHVLRALLGGVSIAGEAQAQGIHPAGVLTVEIPEGRLVASLRTGDKIVRHGTMMPLEIDSLEGQLPVFGDSENLSQRGAACFLMRAELP